MKRITLVALVITMTSFTRLNESTFELNDFKKNFAKVKEELYVSKYEVSNLEYRNFLSDLINRNQNETYQICLPDTLCWKEASNLNEPFIHHYFRNPSYDNYPVVGITYEAANEYCSWLTTKYNQNKKRKYQEVHFRLLNREEWTYAANKGDYSKVYTWGSGFMQNNRKQDLCNYKHTDFIYDSVTKKHIEIPAKEDTISNQKSTITVPTKSYYPSSFGIYNMCGNVAEMIEERGIAKGGSYNDPAYEVRIASERTYTKPQADIGFRVGMKIIEK